MRRQLARLAMGAFLLLTTGCASNPLVGTWTASQTGSGFNFNTTLNLKADGTADVSATSTGGTVGGMMITCSGTLMYTGGRWTSTATTITFSGMPMCSGMITCMAAGMNINVDCSAASGMGMGGPPSGDQMYTLTNNNMTLTFTSSGSMGSSTTFTRSN